MERKNSVFIATSIDGYIADCNGGIDWLNTVPNPDQKDLGYLAFMRRIDALVMGRNTFEKVLSFGISWPYEKPVFVCSSSLNVLPEIEGAELKLIQGTVSEIIRSINDQGFNQLYIDGGQLIQSFLKEDLIDVMIITLIPVVLGGGLPLFGELEKMQDFRLVKSEVFLDQLVQNTWLRVRK